LGFVTNLVHLIKFADYIQSDIRKFVFKKRKEYWQELLNCGILQIKKDRNSEKYNLAPIAIKGRKNTKYNIEIEASDSM